MGSSVDLFLIIVIVLIVAGLSMFFQNTNTTVADLQTYNASNETHIPNGGGGGGGGNPPVITATQQELTYLSSLGNGKVLSAQYMEGGESLSGINKLYQQTGIYPGMVGGDYFEAGSDGINMHFDYATVNANFIDYWNKGGLVTLLMYTPNPTVANPTWESARSGAMTVDFNDLMNKNSATYARFKQELSIVANGLQQLEDMGIIVLLRPYPEMNGNWAWYQSRTPAEYKWLWLETYNYFVNERGLTNLLWIYAPNAGHGNYVEYYPGSPYVDIVGLDCYTDTPENCAGYPEMLTLNKPFAFTELGPSVGSYPNYNIGYFDQLKYIQAIKSKFPKTVFVQFWSGPWGLHSQNNAYNLLTDSWFINRQDSKYELPQSVLLNGNFESSITSWGNHGGGYVTRVSDGKEDVGALHFIPNDVSDGNSTEAWQGGFNVSPGDKMIFEGWFKAGNVNPLTHKWNNGTGYGIDLRTYNTTLNNEIIAYMPNNPTGVFYTFNCPATINTEWTYMRCEATIPCIANRDKGFSTWSVSSGVSGTDKGARMGLWYTPLADKPMPGNLKATVWVHIWHHDTVDEAWIDNVKLWIVKGVQTC